MNLLLFSDVFLMFSSLWSYSLSDIRGLTNASQLEQLNKRYWYVCQDFTEYKYPHQPNRFPDLMMCLPEIRYIAGNVWALPPLRSFDLVTKSAFENKVNMWEWNPCSGCWMAFMWDLVLFKPWLWGDLCHPQVAHPGWLLAMLSRCARYMCCVLMLPRSQGVRPPPQSAHVQHFAQACILFSPLLLGSEAFCLKEHWGVVLVWAVSGGAGKSLHTAWDAQWAGQQQTYRSPLPQLLWASAPLRHAGETPSLVVPLIRSAGSGVIKTSFVPRCYSEGRCLSPCVKAQCASSYPVVTNQIIIT